MQQARRQPLQDTLPAILLRCRVLDAGPHLFCNSERCLRPLPKLRKLYPPELMAETLHIAERCSFSLDQLRYEYPKDLVPPGYSPSQYLRQLVDEGIKRRYPEGAPAQVPS